MEMRAASNAQLRVTGVSSIPAWWCSRGQVIRPLGPTGGFSQKCSYSTVEQSRCIESTFVIELRGPRKPIRVRMTHWMRDGQPVGDRGQKGGKGFGGPGCNKAGKKGKAAVIDVMEVGRSASSTDFNNPLDAKCSTGIKCQRAGPRRPSMTLVTFLLISLPDKKRRKAT